MTLKPLHILLLAFVAITISVTGVMSADAQVETSRKFSDLPLAVLQSRAVAGSAHAQAELGRRYLYGTEGEKDLQRAEEWLQRAADQGLGTAQNTLGILYKMAGDKVTGAGQQDYMRAVEMFKKAAQQH